MEENEKKWDEEKITFTLLREVQRKERENKELVQLPKTFIEDLKNYLKRKAQILSNPEMADFYDIKEIENIKPVIKSIFDKRERKIILFAVRSGKTGTKPRNMLPHEEKMFLKIKNSVLESRKILDELLAIIDRYYALGYIPSQREQMVCEEKKEEEFEREECNLKSEEYDKVEKINIKEEKDEKKAELEQKCLLDYIKIEITKDIPEFVGMDLNRYGPWKKGEIVEVPRKIGEVLIKTDRAKEAE